MMAGRAAWQRLVRSRLLRGLIRSSSLMPTGVRTSRPAQFRARRSAATLAAYRQSIDHHNASQPNRELLEAARAYNHQIVDDMDRISPLAGALMLDVWASPHGFRRCSLEVEWIVDLKEEVDPVEVVHAARLTGFTSDELATKGLSALLRKPG